MQENANPTFLTFAFVLTILAATFAPAADKPAASSDDEEIEFAPRTSAPPANRVGAGTRSEGDLELVALAPLKSVGYTTRGQPVVYYSLSKPTPFPIDVAVNDLKHAENPVLEFTLAKGHPAGLLRIDLGGKDMKSKDGKPVRLEAGVRYEIVMSCQEHNGTMKAAPLAIERFILKEAPPKSTPPLKQAAWYARQGIWFDAIDALNAAIAKTPQDAKLLAARKKLLLSQALIEGPGGVVSEKSKSEPK